MLVITRKQNQRICIGADIIITASNRTRNQVQLRITCPVSIQIRRGEILDCVKETGEIQKDKIGHCILTRRRDETIMIGNNVLIKIIQTGRTKAKIGVDAPRSLLVLRAEIADKVEANLSK